jgi:hypothetical protein
VIPFEEQKKGKNGWIIEISAILLKKNGFKENVTCVCTRPVTFREDSWIRDGRKCMHIETTHGPISGSVGGWQNVYAKRPSWEECLEYARKDRKHPETVRYMERDGDFHNIWGYENGYKKGA